jgi:hypothetical protein
MPRKYIPVKVNGPQRKRALLAIQDLVYYLTESKQRKAVGIPINSIEFLKGIEVYLKLQMIHFNIKPNTEKAENLFRQIESFDMDFAKQVRSKLLY